MKKLTFSLVIFLFSLLTNGQTVILKPQTGCSTEPQLRIQKIELLDTTTAITFFISNVDGDIAIPSKSYIQVVGETEKLFVKSTNGILFNKNMTVPSDKGLEYILYFPPLKSDTKKLDFGEANKGGSWFIYDIALKSIESKVPQNLQGNWFDVNTGDYTIGLFDTTAIYKMKLWSYKLVDLNNGKGTVLLTQNNQSVNLFVKQGEGGRYFIGESKKNMTEFTTKKTEIKAVNTNEDKLFDELVFKPDTATYCGYIKNYSPRIGIKTALIYVNDILTGNQNTYTIKFDSNGTFSIKVPMSLPTEAYIESGFLGRTVFLEPGKTTFQVIDLNSQGLTLWMGDNAKLNFDLQKVRNLYGFDYSEMEKKILDMTLSQYKVFCEEQYANALKKLDLISKENSLSSSAIQLKRIDLEYNHLVNLMSFSYSYESAYRKKNNIPRTQRSLDVVIEKPTIEYYSFLTNEIVNNPLAIVSTGYEHFINRLKYLEILRQNSKNYSTIYFANELLKSGYTLTKEELEYVEAMKEFELPEVKTIIDGNASNRSFLISKYYEKFKKFSVERKGFDFFQEYLVNNGVKLTPDEIDRFNAIKTFDSSELGRRYYETESKYNEVDQAFMDKYKNEITELIRLKPNSELFSALEKQLGIKKGLATDIMYSEDVCRYIVEEMNAVSDEKLKQIQSEFTLPYIAQNIELCNNATKLKIEANKLKTGYVLNEVPKANSDVLFDEIMKKYRGKVVYVDFWATWCSPCRSGIENIKPLKDELANENVVFVYITNESSPLESYTKMIPDIKGEHYRVKSDEWNIIAGKFNISGIPHCALVDKYGVVVNSKLPHMQNGQIKELLMNEIKK